MSGMGAILIGVGVLVLLVGLVVQVKAFLTRTYYMGMFSDDPMEMQRSGLATLGLWLITIAIAYEIIRRIVM